MTCTALGSSLVQRSINDRFVSHALIVDVILYVVLLRELAKL